MRALEETHAARARAAGLPYPIPDPSAPFWATETGLVWVQVGQHHDLSIVDMHRNSEAAVRTIFSSEWQAYARSVAAARTVHATTVEDLMQELLTQFMQEHGMDREAACLQLAAASKLWSHDSKTFSGYMVCNTSGTTIHLDGPSEEVPMPDQASFSAMQESLSLEEQLQYLVLLNGMQGDFRRVAGREALPLVNLDFCRTCGVNGGVDHTGTAAEVQSCGSHAACCAHAACAHTVQLSPAQGAMMCTGLTSNQGAWCLRMTQWNGSRELGLLHPLALSRVVAIADTYTRDGRWVYARDATGSEFDMCIRKYGHTIFTGNLPPDSATAERCSEAEHMALAAAVDIYPRAGALGQLPPPVSCTCFLTAGTEATLRQLRLFHEPTFSRMCDRFRAEPATWLTQWLALRLPLLPGTTGAGGDARRMHALAHTAAVSLRSRQRMRSRGRRPEHWIVSEIDPVLPATTEEDAAALSALGVDPQLPAAACARAPESLPDVADDSSEYCRASAGACATFPVRIMLNPSCHLQTLCRILQDAACRYELAGALAHFLAYETPRIIGPVTRADAEAFRAACLRSPFYGRVFLWMVTKEYRSAPGDDASDGLLASDHPQPVARRCSWDPVRMLRRCTDASYVELECGAMLHWQQVVSSCPMYLFELRIDAIQQLATTLDPMPDSVHVVPCGWQDLEVGAIVGSDASAVVVSRSGEALPPGTCTEVYYMRHGGSDDDTAFMRDYRGSRWQMHTNNVPALHMAAHAKDMYEAM